MKKKFWINFSWITFFVFALIFIKVFLVGLYLVPSVSMLPNLIPGDRVVANKMAYSLKIPFAKKTFYQRSLPKRGDVILFSFENEDDIYIKRVIGLPGDFITFYRGQVFIERETLGLVSTKADDDYDPNLVIYEEDNEKLLEQSHLVGLAKTPSASFFETRRFLVPPNKVFVLGDNRDNSVDSRVKGYVDLGDIHGRASFVAFSTFGTSSVPKFRNDRFFASVSR